MNWLRIALLMPAIAPPIAWSAPPVTDPAVPPPGPAQAALWLKAVFQAPVLALAGDAVPRSEAARMLLTVQHDVPLGPGVGWYGPAGRRYDWNWMASRFDADRNGQITRAECESVPEFFNRLDRDSDGAITARDFDWSENSPWVRLDAQSLRVFRQIDSDGNGRVGEDELLAFMRRRAGDKGYLTPEDIRTILAVDRPAKAEKRVAKSTWMNTLMIGDLGSALEGPRVGHVAPDFTLPLQSGKGAMTLSQFRHVKPVVLIFGSFT